MKLPLGQYYQLLATYLAPQRRRTVWMALFLLGSIALRLVNPQIMRYFIDTAVGGGDYNSLLLAAGLFLAIAVVGQALAVGATYYSEQVAWTATNALRYDLVAHVLKLDLSFHKQHTPGELIERIDGDVNKLSTFFSRFTINLVGSLLMVIGVLVLVYSEDWRMGSALTVFTLVGVLILVRIREFATPFWAKERQVNAEFYGFLGEHLGATEDLRANGATNYVMQRFQQALRQWLPIRLKANLAGYSMWATNVAVFTVGTMIAFGLGAYLWQIGVMTLGTVYLIYQYTQLMGEPIAQLRVQLTELQQAEASIHRINALLQTQSRLAPDPTLAPTDQQLPAGPLELTLDQVAFSYADEPDERVLHAITLHLRPGRVLGLLGRTGSGKSTLARLLLRLYDPTSGDLRVGGIDPATLPLATYRQRVGMVTQDVQLFQASVRDNLTFFNPTIPDAQIHQVIEEVGLDGWLRTLPQGLETVLTTGSAGLSAGQAQLLAFARIFLTNPGLVILDEASSRLDPATEQLLENAVDKLLRSVDAQRTAILIAHRLGTVQRADEILILENGCVVEHGDRIALAANPQSRFYALLRTGMEEVLA